ncbi:MAG: hypothetical protein IKJ88_01590 [Clostridia bacterium]|nr:hypothetical protein [Clostridia bacterium]
MRYISITMICMSFILTGAYFAKQAKRRVYFLENLSSLFSAFSFSASAGGKDIKSICKEISVLDKFECFSFLDVFLSSLYDGCDLCAVWCECVENADELSSLKNEEKQVLKSFSQVFLSSGVEEFCDTCKKFSEKFDRISDEAKESSLKNQKILISGSALVAAAFFIILF